LRVSDSLITDLTPDTGLECERKEKRGRQ
jgi:hypothetical protein